MNRFIVDVREYIYEEQMSDGRFYDQYGFHKTAFNQYLYNSFLGFGSCFLRELVDNVVEFACKKNNNSKDQAVCFISELIPEVSFEEVSLFASDEILTEESIRRKHDLLK